MRWSPGRTRFALVAAAGAALVVLALQLLPERELHDGAARVVERVEAAPGLTAALPAGEPVDPEPQSVPLAAGLPGAAAADDPHDILVRDRSLPVRVLGRVVDEAGRGVGGATVEICGPTGFAPFGMLPPPVPTFASTTADPTGRFVLAAEVPGALALPRHNEDLGTARGPDPQLVASAPGFLRGVAPLRIPGAGDIDAGEIVLGPGGALELTILDSVSRPVEAPRIAVSYGAARLSPSQRLSVDRPQVRALGAGRHVIDGLPGGSARLMLALAGHQAAELGPYEVVVGKSYDAGTVRLLAGAVLEGSAVGPQGVGVEGAWVLVADAGDYGGMDDDPNHVRIEAQQLRNRLPPERVVITAPGGGFRADSLAPGRYALFAGAAGHDTIFERRVEVPGPSVRLRFADQGRVLLEFVDVATAAPVQVSRVAAADRQSRVLRPLSRPEAGQPWVLHPEGDSIVYARSAAYPLQPFSVADVEPGVERRERLPLAPGSRVAVTVVDSLHQPLPGRGVRVEASDPLLASHGLQESGITGDDGRVRLGPIAPGKWRVSAGGGRFASREQVVTIGPDDRELEVRLALKASAAVRGRVFDARGQPAAGQRIELADSAPPNAEAVADDQGEFRFDEVKPGTYQVRAWKPFVAERVRVAEGEEVEVELRLPAPARVSGRVTSAGQPLAGARVALAVGDWYAVDFEVGSITDARGEYAIDVADAGDYGVMAIWPAGGGSDLSKFKLAPGDERVVDLELPAGSLQGRVVAAEDGTPLPGAEITLQIGDRTVTTSTDADGSFEFAHLAPGDGRVYVSAPGRGEGQAACSVSISPAEPLRLALFTAAVLEGEVSRPDGSAPVGDVRVLLALGDGSAGEHDAQVKAGVYRADGLGPGLYRARVVLLRMATDHQFFKVDKTVLAEADVELKAGEERRLDFHLPAGD